MKRTSSKASKINGTSQPGDAITVIVTEKQYLEKKRQGLTDDEVLKPGVYQAVRGGFLKRHPELKPLQRTQKVRVTIQLDQDIVEAFKRAAETDNALPYQTQINLALRNHLQEQSLSLSASDLPTIQRLARAIAQELQALAPKRK
jgi:uncharacterized protein (DUF4415 family)